MPTVEEPDGKKHRSRKRREPTPGRYPTAPRAPTGHFVCPCADGDLFAACEPCREDREIGEGHSLKCTRCRGAIAKGLRPMLMQQEVTLHQLDEPDDWYDLPWPDGLDARIVRN